jgi:copper homeostasis protein
MKIEVVVYNVESALEAQKGGADRIELCDNPGEGGTTPSVGIIELVRKNLNIEVYVMIRPRGGDFVYTNLEVEAMMRDIDICKELKIEGVVFGILNEEGRIDRERCKKLIEHARPLKVTCHRAFDMTRDAVEALEDCVEAGFDRILTSGRLPSAMEGSGLIRQLVQQAKSRIIMMPGGGINEQNVVDLLEETGVKEIHFSAKLFQPSKNTRYNHLISFLDPLPNDSGKYVTDAATIKKIKALIGK